RVAVPAIPWHLPIAYDDKPVDDNPLRDGFVTGKLHVAACIIGAVAGDVDSTPRTFERRTLQLSSRELDAAADRGTVGERTRQFQELITKFTRSLRAGDDRRVEHELLGAHA